MTDFGPLIANPKSFLLGAAAQFGIFGAYIIAMLIGFNDMAAAAIAIIGGADGPTSIYLAMKLHQTDIMGPIAVAAYSLYVAGTDYSAPYYESADYEGRAADKNGACGRFPREKEFFFSHHCHDYRLRSAAIDHATGRHADVGQSLSRKRRRKAADRNCI